MNIYLKELSKNDGNEVYDMLQGIENNDNGFMNDVKNMPYENYRSWLIENENYSKGIGLKNGWVPQTTFWLYFEKTPVGIGRIRHYLNENLKKDGGHIGYAISLKHRGNGYGNKFLELLIKECIKMEIFEIHTGANKDNERSNKIILYNRGVLYRETESKNYYLINTKREA